MSGRNPGAWFGGKGLHATAGALVARGLLVILAAAQVGLAVPELFSSDHSSAELGTWQVVAAVGFLTTAARPARAGDLLPIFVCAALLIMFVSTRDIAAGHTTTAQESSHLVLAGGFVLLTFLWHRQIDYDHRPGASPDPGRLDRSSELPGSFREQQREHAGV